MEEELKQLVQEAKLSIAKYIDKISEIKIDYLMDRISHFEYISETSFYEKLIQLEIGTITRAGFEY